MAHLITSPVTETKFSDDSVRGASGGICEITWKYMLRCVETVFTARSLAERGIAKANCCPSVRPSVTLRYRDHIG